MENKTTAFFERLRNGETISSNDPLAYQMREASFGTKQLGKIDNTSGLVAALSAGSVTVKFENQ